MSVPTARGLRDLLAAREIVIFCGPGGVGKTTVAAAAGAQAAAVNGGRVLVLTIDPARRLADALGIGLIGNEETEVDLGPGARGRLFAAMLDTEQSWDDLVRRHAPDAQTRDRILANALYRNIAGRFVQSHDYIAMERLYQIHSEGGYDLIVLDTPPSRNAIDFLEAPERMAEFFSSRFLRMLTAPYRNRLTNLASRPFHQIADRILGTQFLSDIAEFFLLFQSMYQGFVDRSRAVSRLLRDHRTSFVVVTTLEGPPLAEARRFVSGLAEREFHLGGMVLNRALPTYFLDPTAERVAARLAGGGRAVAGEAFPGHAEPDAAGRVLQEVGESFCRFSVVAQREADLRRELTGASEAAAVIPYMPVDIADMNGLMELGEHLFDAPGGAD
ncbi:MAG TPA: ArsA-related P-loop ATPase [Acidimicrobiales bacterium]|nr:ArsA-related P-loop ATPase [Acidimicrobiales bacterium]